MFVSPVNNTNFEGVKKFNTNRISRKVVDVVKTSPKGITKTPVRLKNDEMMEFLQAAAGFCVGCSVLSCLSDCAQGSTAGSEMAMMM